MELMVVVAIIGILALLAVAAFDRIKERTIVSTYCNDVRQMAQAFEAFSMEHGRWPLDTAPGATPPGMLAYLPAAWFRAPIVGGQWEWDGEVDVKMITSFAPTAPEGIFLRIDAELDDGDPDTGFFRRNGTEWNYILEDFR